MSSNTDEKEKLNNIDRKVTKILETRIDNDKETLIALKELSNFFTENTIHSRRNLHSKIEKRSLEINEDFLDAFRQVKESLDSVYEDVTEMSNSIQSIADMLNSSMAKTHALIEQTSKLQQERQKLCMEEDVANAFMNRFQLNAAELSALRDTSVNEDFFTALEKLQKIHSDCRQLMHSGHQTAALDIMDQITMYQEAAMERLYRWAQAHCKNIESAATSELLARSLSKLQSRPALYKCVVNEYCIQRRGVVVRVLVDALTRGGPGGVPPPIEMHAHDPHRYTADMLAFLRQLVPAEASLLTTLLGQTQDPDKADLMEVCLSDITEGVCNPLRVRIEQVISSDIPIKSLCTISTLISFYQRIFSQEVGAKSGLAACLASMGEAANERLVVKLSETVRQLVVDKLSTPPGPDLNPSPALFNLTSLLQDILSAPSDAQTVNKFVGCVVDPLIQGVTLSASRLSTTDMAVFLLNCLQQVHNTLALYQFLDQRLERIQAQCDAQLDSLTSEQASFLVANLNLGPVYTILQEQGSSPLSQIPGMQPNTISTIAAKLESYLCVPDMLVLPQVNLLQSTVHRSTVQLRATELILAIYKELYQAIHNPNNLYESPDEILPRTPQQLKDILLGSVQTSK